MIIYHTGNIHFLVSGLQSDNSHVLDLHFNAYKAVLKFIFCYLKNHFHFIIAFKIAIFIIVLFALIYVDRKIIVIDI